MTRRFSHWLWVLGSLVVFSLAAGAVAGQGTNEAAEKKSILVLHSYSKGYKWTENISEGIASVLAANPQVQIMREDMDTMRIADPAYLTKLYEVYKYKFRNIRIDAVICSDDNAFLFLKTYREELFPGIPIIFCGVNYFEDAMLSKEERKTITGVVEAQDIAATIETALNLHSQTQKIYVVNERTTTGDAVKRSLQEVMPRFTERVSFISLEDLGMPEILNRIQNLDEESLILYLNIFTDAAGQQFTYDESIRLISEKSKVPVYGCWDFSLGHGLTGGMLTSGYYQGATAARLALRILNGEPPESIPIVKDSPNRFMFDDIQLKKFSIPKNALPSGSMVINELYTKQKQILILNSYHQGMSWTDSIVSGVRSALKDETQFDLQIDYMDIKHNTNPEYVQKLFEVYRNKFSHRRFDAIVVSDDDAYNFMLKYHALLAPDTPVVFCGVNVVEDQEITRNPWSTGVVEAIDVRSTLKVTQKLHPGVQQVVVINDRTTTGKANKEILANIMPDFPDLQFTFLEDMNMFEVQQHVAGLSPDSVVLLLTFNADKSNNTFSYEESADLITHASRVPVYAVWDFYLGHGIMGGMLTNGFSQGQRAGHMVLEILKGKSPSAIAIEKHSPNRYMFDYATLQKFGISLGQLPEGSVVQNRPISFYEKNSDVILGGFLALSITAFFIQRDRSRKRLEYYAATDVLTGGMNRRTGLLFLEKQLALAQRTGKELCICFVDINNLKLVNDNFGHQEGDQLIVTAVGLMKQKLRDTDVLCRFGGDEFLIIHPNCISPQAEAIWERIASRLKEHNNQALPYQIGFSHGVAEYRPKTPVTMTDLLQIADEKMYYEKSKQKKRQEIDFSPVQSEQ